MTGAKRTGTSVPTVYDDERGAGADEPRRRHRRVLAALALPLLVVLAGCAKDAPQDYFEPTGEGARKIDGLQTWVFSLAGIVGVLVFLAVLFVVVRFRQRAGDEAPAKQIHGHTVLEVGWTILPALILVAVAVPTVVLVLDLADEPEEAIQVDVVGQQWWWEFTYPEEGIVTANELVIPVDTDVQLNITSRDVIHSFWIPKLNGKRDAVPGRFHPLTFRAEEEGVFMGQCTEFCGLSHANMRQVAVVLSKEDYADWVANQREAAVQPEDGSTAAEGYEAFGQRCASCHSVAGHEIQPADVPLVAGAAPDLTHLMSRDTFAGATFQLEADGCTTAPEGVTGTAPECLNRTDLEAWLRDPTGMKPMMPDDQRGMPTLGLSEDEINALVDYLSTLK